MQDQSPTQLTNARAWGPAVTYKGRRDPVPDSGAARDIALLLVLKVALVLALYVFLIRPALHPAHDPLATAAAVVGAAPMPYKELSR